MKRDIVLLLLSLFCLSALAGETVYLVVWSTDQTRVAYALDEHPRITFTETELVIESSETKVSYPLENMDRLTYETSASNIRDLQSDRLLPRLEGETLLFPFLEANISVSIYRLDGTLVFKKTILQEGEYAFPLSALTPSVYLVSVNGLTYKIVRR